MARVNPEDIANQLCKCGHARNDHNEVLSKCRGSDANEMLPRVLRGGESERFAECQCERFLPQAHTFNSSK